MQRVDSDRLSDRIDWLSPLNALWGVVGIYIVGRLIIEHVFSIAPIWGGSLESEHKALWLVAIFCAAVSIGVILAPRRPLVRMLFIPRGRLGERLGTLLSAVYIAIGLGAVLVLISRLGGLSRVLENQAAWASQLKEMGLAPLYGLTFLLVIGSTVLAFRALVRGQRLRAAVWFLCVLSVALVLGRRVMILFAALPLLSVVHYHLHRLDWRHVLVLGTVGFTLFTGILLLRLETGTGSLAESVGTSLEYAVYDALVITVDDADNLESLGPSYFARHPADFWGSNAGALFLQRLTGFQWTGGATPPTAVGTLWVYYGTVGLVVWGLVIGFCLGRLRLEATGSAAGALVYGFVLFFWFDFLRNGDIVLGLKLFIRYGAMLGFLLLCFYRPRLTAVRRLEYLPEGTAA